MDGFSSIVANTWLHFQGFGTSDSLLAAKFKHLKMKLKEWRAISYPKAVEDRKMLKKKMDSLDHISESRVFMDSKRVERQDGFKKNHET